MRRFMLAAVACVLGLGAMAGTASASPNVGPFGQTFQKVQKVQPVLTGRLVQVDPAGRTIYLQTDGGLVRLPVQGLLLPAVQRVQGQRITIQTDRFGVVIAIIAILIG